MKFVQALKELESSGKFKEWKKSHKDSFLAHGFLMSDTTEWQIGFFNPDTEKVQTFVMADEIMMNPESEVLSKDIRELDSTKVKITAEAAFRKSDETQKSKYAVHMPLKKIAILQNSNGKQIWNITFVTKTFKTLNFQIDAATGEVLSDKILEIFKFDK